MSLSMMVTLGESFMQRGRYTDEKHTINGSSGSRFVSSVIVISTDSDLVPPGMKVMVPP